MNEKYGGLVSNPRNTKDTQVVKSITYMTNGTVVETVNLNAWPAATESDTPSPTPTSESFFVKKDDNSDYFVVGVEGKWQFYQNIQERNQQFFLKCSGPGTDITPVNSGPIGGTINYGPLKTNSGFYTFTSKDVTFTWDGTKFVASLSLAEFEG